MLLGVGFTILVLLWQAPSEGIWTATLLLMLSFVFLFNSTWFNNKAKYENDAKEPNKKLVTDCVRWAEHFFNFGFTCILISFTIMAYKYLELYLTTSPLILVPSFVFIITAIICMIIYVRIDGNSKQKRKIAVRFKKSIWVILESFSLVVITLDYLGIITII